MRAIIHILSETECFNFMITNNYMIKNIQIDLLIMMVQILGYQDALALSGSAYHFIPHQPMQFIFAILTQDLDLVRDALQDPRINYDAWYCNPLQKACEYGQLDAVKLLINDYGINISSYDNTALCKLARRGVLIL